jgi:hypothetical protein
MMLNIALSIHVGLFILGLVGNFIYFMTLSNAQKERVTLSFTWFGKAAIISLFILLYRIGG